MIIVEPPGEPTTKNGLLSFKTIVGVIEESGLLFGSIAFASLPIRPNTFGTPGLEEKSSISLLRKNPAPFTTHPFPYPKFIVVVTLTALPH